jgi:hypothetical protein
MRRILECGVLLRLYTMTMSGLYAYTGLSQPETLTYAVAHADRFAHMTMYGLAALTVLGLADLVVNDLMPDRYVIARALHDRHLVSMAIAGCFAIQMSTCVRYGLPHAILPFYGAYVLLVPVSAFVDVRKRYKTNKDCE